MITFKSNKFFYKKEKDGRKPNTLRLVTPSDERYDEIMDMLQGKIELGKIRIVLAENLQESFERQITDVSYYDERFIISWRKE
jgi:hypothetical protein